MRAVRKREREAGFNVYGGENVRFGTIDEPNDGIDFIAGFLLSA